MICLPPPHDVTWEEVANSCISNFQLREDLIMHGEMFLQQFVPNCALLTPFFTFIESGLYIPLWTLRDQPLRNCFATGESKDF